MLDGDVLFTSVVAGVVADVEFVVVVVVSDVDDELVVVCAFARPPLSRQAASSVA